jgi:hypothetical protein
MESEKVRPYRSFFLTDVLWSLRTPESHTGDKGNGMVKRRDGLPSVGAVSRTALRRVFWHGIEHELVEQGYLKENGKSFVILQPLPTKNDFEIELRAKWTHTLGEWLEAVQAEINHIIEELDDLEDDEVVTEARTHLNYIRDTFPFDTPEPFGSVSIYVNPRHLVVTCKHRRAKPREDAAAQVEEIRAILRACMRQMHNSVTGDDADTFASNLSDLSTSLKQVQLPVVENIE